MANYDYVKSCNLNSDNNVVTIRIGSSATNGNTTVLIDESTSYDISGSNSKSIGNASGLPDSIYISTSAYCVAPQVDTIEITYLINDNVLLTHQSPKNGSDTTDINITVNFNRP